MGTWQNDDGLFLKYGVSETTVDLGGELDTGGNELSEFKVEFDYSDLAAYGTEKIMSDGLVIPDNFWLKSAELYVQEAFDSSGDSATLTIGLIRAQDRSTAIDADGIDATIAETAIDAVGDTIACDGVLIDTAITVPGLVTMTVGTEDFTAGKGRLVIKGYHTA